MWYDFSFCVVGEWEEFEIGFFAWDNTWQIMTSLTSPWSLGSLVNFIVACMHGTVYGHLSNFRAAVVFDFTLGNPSVLYRICSKDKAYLEK